MTLTNAIKSASLAMMLSGSCLAVVHEPSTQPPGGLAVNEVPMFVNITFDDNEHVDANRSGGMNWLIDLYGSLKHDNGNGNPATFDGAAPHTTFFVSCHAIKPEAETPIAAKAMWHDAFEQGHEIANHTVDHLWGGQQDSAFWQQQIGDCTQLIEAPFVDGEQADASNGVGAVVNGYRTPFGDFNQAMFSVLLENGFRYEASMVDGYQPERSAGNYFWPYTLENGSPGMDFLAALGFAIDVQDLPGMWLVPNSPLVVPPDEALAQYGLTESIRNKIKSFAPWFDVTNGKAGNSDWNFLYEYRLSTEEILAIWQYSFDLSRQGNRAPFTIVAHANHYSDKWDELFPIASTAAERRDMLQRFIEYTLSFEETRIVTANELLDWMENPVALGSEHCEYPSWQTNLAYPQSSKVIYQDTLYQAKWWSYNTPPTQQTWSSWQAVRDC